VSDRLLSGYLDAFFDTGQEHQRTITDPADPTIP
jgi:hypothetical protein